MLLYTIMNHYGEKIGTIVQDGVSKSEGAVDAARYLMGRHLVEMVRNSVLAGYGVRQLLISGADVNGFLSKDLYANPPITDPLEAKRLSVAIVDLIEVAMMNYPGVPLEASELDTFIPVQPEQ